MKRVIAVARWEFISTVARKEFILALIGVPLIFIGLPGLLIYFMMTGDGASRTTGAIGLIDRARLVDIELAGALRPPTDGEAEELEYTQPASPYKFILYEDVDEALRSLNRGEVVAAYVIEPDYLATGKVVAYSREGGVLSGLSSPGENQLENLLRASIVKGQIAQERAERVIAPAQFRRLKVGKEGELKEVQSRLEKVAFMFFPFGMVVLLSSAVLASSGYLLQGTAQEKENRVMEVLISSIKPSQLLAGKILGLGAVGLLQVTVYIALLALPAAFILPTSQISVWEILLSVVYMLLGYFLFASLMAGTGMIGNTVQESTQYSLIWSFISVLPLLLVFPLSNAPNSLLARALSYFPLTAPGTMILRVVISKVPLLDVVISISVLIVGIYIAIKGAAKVFRAAALMYGKSPNLPEFLRWLREA